MSRADAAVEALRLKAIDALEPGGQYGVASDPSTFGRGKKGAVLLAIATWEGSLVLAIDNADWASAEGSVAETLIKFCGGTTPTPHEKALQKKALQKKA